MRLEVRRRKCFCQKGLVREDRIRLSGRNLTRACRGGAAKRGAPELMSSRLQSE
jgi:hypothetical protein